MINPFSLISTGKMVAGLLAFNAFTTGAAYVWGRIDGRALERAGAIESAKWVGETDRVTREELIEKQRAETEAAAKKENANDAIADELDTPEAGDDMPALSADWLRKLERVK